jgi:hypothetical protein
VVEEEIRKEATYLKSEDDDVWSPGCCGSSQKFLWDLFEKPESSIGAKVTRLAAFILMSLQVINVVSVLFVVVSTIAMVIGTLPAIMEEDDKGQPTDNPYISMIETICITWFTLEYILRWAGKCSGAGSIINCNAHFHAGTRRSGCGLLKTNLFPPGLPGPPKNAPS